MDLRKRSYLISLVIVCASFVISYGLVTQAFHGGKGNICQLRDRIPCLNGHEEQRGTEIIQGHECPVFECVSDKKKGSDPVSRWDGDAVSGTTVSDTSNGNNGTMIGRITVVPGNVGKAFKFDGAGGYIKMGNPKSLNFGTGPFSLEVWFNWDGRGSSVNNIIRKSNYPTSGTGSGYWLRIGRDNKIIEFSTGATTVPEGQSLMTAPISSGAWHHVVVSKDRSGAMKLYVDAESRGTFLRQASNTETTSGAPFTLGAWDDRFGVTELFSGLIERVSVYNRALSQSEVKSLYGGSGNAISYPVPELGNCKNESECRAYCENRDDINVVKACVAFAEKYNLISKEELDIIKKLLEFGYTKGPGGCKDQKQCEAYCEDTAHINECLVFAEKLNLLPPDQLAEAKKVADALKTGAKLPGGCKDKISCETYCEDLSHLAECVEFAEKSGINVKYDLEIAKKIVKAGVTKTPGGCKGKEGCEAYCGTTSHLGECADFAEKIGMMSKEDAEMARKIARSGITKFPGNCKDKESCDVYCKDDAHFDECVDFAEKAGIVTGKEVELARKTHGKSPGDCAKGVRSAEEGKKACSAYCGKPENQQVCMDFAVQIGLISAEDAKELGGGGSLEDLNLCMQNMDQETLKCFDVLDKNIFEKMKVGELPDDPSDLQKMMKGMKGVKACMNKKTDETLGQLPPGGLACLEKEFGENPIEKIKSGKVSCQKFSGMQDRLKSCFSEIIQKQLDTCLALSCSEMTACFKKLGGGKKADSSQIDPAIKSKMEGKLNSCIQNQIDECLAKDCSEVNSCFAKLKEQGGESEGGGEGKLDPSLEAKITAKITGCMKTQKGGGGGAPQGGSTFPSGGFPSGGDFTPPKGGFPSGGQPQIPEYKVPEFKTPQIPQVPGTPSQNQTPQIPQYPQVPGGSSYEIPVTPELCANFTNIPACSYAGAPDSQNYKLCKKCYSDR